MTCREKLAMEHPECVDAEHLGGCRGCPEDFGYLPPVEECSISRHPCPDRCTKCWDREIPVTIKANETVSIEDLIKFVNGLNVDGKIISVSFYEDSTTVNISKFENED